MKHRSKRIKMPHTASFDYDDLHKQCVRLEYEMGIRKPRRLKNVKNRGIYGNGKLCGTGTESPGRS